MAEHPAFSIVVPCYNYGRYLTAALDSIFAQNRNDVEVLLVDDASTDETPQIAQRYADRVNYIRNERNLGAGGAWRLGLERVRGHYVMKLDADDELLPGSIAAATAAFESNPEIGIVITSVMVKRERQGTLEVELVTHRDRTLTAAEFRSKLLGGFFFRMPGCILRTEILVGHEPPDPALYQIHDWEYFLRVTRGYGGQLLREPLAVYRVHNQSISAKGQFDNRLYKDIQRWLEIAKLPGERQIEKEELALLRGSCADLMLIGFGSKLNPKSYIGYAYKYFQAFRISVRAGPRQVIRVHLALVARIGRNLKKTIRKPIHQSRFPS